MGRPRKYETPEALQKAVDAYFALCKTEKKPYTITGLALGLGLTSRLALMNYQKRGETADIVKRAKLKVENYLETIALDSKHPAGAIFNLKANFGWKDTQELDVKASLTVKIVKFATTIENKGQKSNADGSHPAK